VEWKQITPFLGWQDYMATGQPDLALAFTEKLHGMTMIKYMDNATGVLETDKMGRHIVDWMPDTPTSSGERDETVGLGEYSASKHTSVSNGFAAQGLNLLAQMLKAGGDTGNATQFAAESAGLMKAMKATMWNGTNWCDGICTEVIRTHARTHTHTRTHAHPPPPTHPHPPPTHPHTRTHAPTHAHTHSPTHAHMSTNRDILFNND
jgi:hypothetical protein